MASYTPACLVMFPRPLITLAVIAFGPVWGFFSLAGICWPQRHLKMGPHAPRWCGAWRARSSTA